MADEPLPGNASEKGSPKTGHENLRPIQKGEKRNPTGTNGYTRAQARFRKFAMALDEDGRSRDEHVLEAIYTSALKPGTPGAADRRLWMEQLRGKAKQQVEVGGKDGAALKVVAFLPDNGHGPDDPEPDDGEPGPSAE